MELMAWKKGIDEAQDRISSLVRKTPLEYSSALSSQGTQVYLKCENEQVTGSFKVRGAVNKICKHIGDLRKSSRGPITASTGNHGLACTYAFRQLGIGGTIYVPSNISHCKKDALVSVGAELVYGDTDCAAVEAKARQDAQNEGRLFVSPYNDDDVICGQGTIGAEILADLPAVDAVFVSVGGGGLISGIAAYIKSARPSAKIIGCQPVRSKVMYESIRAGRIIFEESMDTLSDGTAGSVEDNAVTFDLCRSYVDEWVMVSEEEIKAAIYLILLKHHKVIEGAAGVAVAAFVQSQDAYIGQSVAILLCGANIDPGRLGDIIQEYKHK